MSSATAEAMASSVRELMKSDIAVATTGVAGPSGAEPGKPVGTVWLSLATPHGVSAQLLNLPGDRDEVRRFTVRAALELLEQESSR